MSISRTVTVWCDGLDSAGCTEWVHGGPEDGTATQARAEVRRFGWRRVAGRDLCPECAQDLALAAASESAVQEESK